MTPLPASRLGLNIADVDRQLAEFRGFPLHLYWDPAIHEFELDAIFSKSWQYFCPLEKLAKLGDVVTGVVGRTPIVLTRDEQGALHGLVNVCRHRGYKVVGEEQKNCRLLLCRYHAWSYKLNGELARAPDTENEPGFKAGDYGLVRVAVDTWGPGVFVNPDQNAKPLRQDHPLLDAWTEEREFIVEPGAYQLHRVIPTEQQSNWKLWYDNGVECYHCPHIHGASFGEAFNVREGEYSYDLKERMMTYAFLSEQDTGDGDQLRSATYRSFQIFPGCQIIQQDDLMIMAKMVPTGPESCRYTAHYFAQKGADPARVDRWIEVWNQTFDEDAAATEIQQANLKSPHAKPFRFVSNREEPAVFINGLIWEAYKAHLVDDGHRAMPDAAE